MIGEKAAKGLRPFPPQPFGRYTLLAPLAMGGMGEIFLARMEGAQGFEKMLVIKKILPQLAQEQDFVDRFVTEAKILVKLHHGSVAQVLDMGQIDDDYFIALEFVDGKDLRKVAARCKERSYPLPQGLALYVMVRVLDALAYAHRKKGDDDQELNLVHRDVSPQNVLISYEGEVKVIDFGLAKSSLASGRTSPSMILGKFFYMAPEQAKHSGVDRRSDVYAAGIVLYELLAGKNPFEGVPQAEIITRVANPRIEPIGLAVPGVSASLDAQVMRALAPDPKDRFASAEEMRGRLTSVMLELDPAAGPESLAQFMRAVFAAEYQQERKVFAALREAALGASAATAISAAPSRPKLVPQPEGGGLAMLGKAGKAGETGAAEINPSSAATTTMNALPPSAEEFSFGHLPASSETARGTDPARPSLDLPDLPASLPPEAPAIADGHTVPFAALPVTVEPRLQSSLPILMGTRSEELEPLDTDPQEWLAPAASAPAAPMIDSSHTVPFAALPMETPLPTPNPTPPFAVEPAPVLVSPSLPAAPAAAAPRAAQVRSLPRVGAAPASDPVPAAPPTATVASAPSAPPSTEPKVVLTDDLAQGSMLSARPTMQVSLAGPPEPSGPGSVPAPDVAHAPTHPVIAAAPPAGTLPPPPATLGKKPAPKLSAEPTKPPAAMRPAQKTVPSRSMSGTRAWMFVALGVGVGVAILGLLALIMNH